MRTMQAAAMGTAAGPTRAVQRPATRPAARLRLTRRGRFVVVVTALVLMVVGFSMGRVSSQAAGPQRHVAPTVTVRPGESLWALAARVAPHADPRLVVSEIQQLNHLSSAEVYGGQQLVVPGR
ncbi:MAG TPA: LysM peptidoglycan-binding domain-containing protein [Mycobacteriales bacterium]|nr:LysM peptidoglycan-binding domain-containing protein [Mycobacteriales bacterium]